MRLSEELLPSQSRFYAVVKRITTNLTTQKVWKWLSAGNFSVPEVNYIFKMEASRFTFYCIPKRGISSWGK